MTRFPAAVLVSTVALIACSAPARAQAPGRPPAPAAINPVKVDEAVEKGAKYLLAQIPHGFTDYGVAHNDKDWPGQNSGELVLYTLIFSGIDLNNPAYLDLFNKSMAQPPQHTYEAALRGMALEALDREKFREGIAECAQYLVDNQCKNGQWGYGEPMEKSPHTWTPDPAKPVTFSTGGASTAAKDGGVGGSVTGHDKPSSSSSSSPGGTHATKAVKKIPIARRKDGPAGGDNSNTQYALLGLRACLDAGIAIPADVLPLAEGWWIKDQKGANDVKKDGGWGYSFGGRPGLRAAPSGAMVAGGISSIAICCAYTNRPWKAHPSLVKGVAWLINNYAIDKHPDNQDDKRKWLYYFLYSLERAGVLSSLEKFGPHEWYPEGAQYILSNQKPDGSWADDFDPVAETCFAILFLRRATKALPKTYTH